MCVGDARAVAIIIITKLTESVRATGYNNRNKHNKVTEINEPRFVALEVTVKKKKNKGSKRLNSCLYVWIRVCVHSNNLHYAENPHPRSRL